MCSVLRRVKRARIGEIGRIRRKFLDGRDETVLGSNKTKENGRRSSAYTLICLSRSNACCCLLSGVVTTSKVGASGLAPTTRQVLRTIVVR